MDAETFDGFVRSVELVHGTVAQVKVSRSRRSELAGPFLMEGEAVFYVSAEKAPSVGTPVAVEIRPRD